MSATLMQVEMPAVSRQGGSKYAFDELVVGGPTLVETDVVNASKVASRLQSALAAAKKRNPELKNRTFRVRTFQKDGVDHVGVWRVE